MTNEGVPREKTPTQIVNEDFDALGTRELIAEAHAVIAQSEETRATARAATTAHLDQAARNLEPFAQALADSGPEDDDVLLLTEVVASDEEHEDPTK